MNWEDSKVLTPLKRDFLKAFFQVETTFFLSGGSALGVFYLDHRRSYDLDFFSMQEVHWQALKGQVQKIASSIGSALETLSASPYFQRMRLTRDDETEILDFIIEFVPQVFPEKNRFGNIVVDPLIEIGINKICTLVHRSELKDLIDLYFLQRDAEFDIIANWERACTKEGGLEPAMVSYLLTQIDIDEIPHYLEKELRINQLRTFVDEFRKKLAMMASP